MSNILKIIFSDVPGTILSDSMAVEFHIVEKLKYWHFLILHLETLKRLH